MRIVRNSRHVLIIVCSFSACVHIGIGSLSARPLEKSGTILTNYEVLEKISAEAVDHLIVSMGPKPAGTFITLRKEKGIGDADFLLENVLLERLRNAGMRVNLASQKSEEDATLSPAFRMSYQIIRMSLTYPSITRRYLLGPKEVERAAEIDLYVQLIDLETADVVWVGKSHREWSDVIAYSLLQRVEEKQYAFTRPERNEIRWSRFLEPVVVTGIVAGLVYLFFSNQSSE